MRPRAGLMKLDQAVRHKSEDLDEEVLLDVVKALGRRGSTALTIFHTLQVIASMAVPSSSIGIFLAPSVV